MESIEFFQILDKVDSTNNYAMGAIHAGMAKHRMAWFALDQLSGKGQRGKVWLSESGENIIMSIVFQPSPLFFSRPFLFNALISNCCHTFLSAYIKNEIRIKWPNDIYLRDRKAGGILIENIFQGVNWKWAVVGIGINVNQLSFPPNIKNPVSMKLETGKTYDTIRLAKELYEIILRSVSEINENSLPEILKDYNKQLFLLNKKVRLRKQNVVFETTIKAVNEQGQLQTSDAMPRVFEFGEVEWIL